MSNEFVARKGLVVKTVITGETETNVLVKNTSGLVKANPQSNFVTNIDDTWTSTDKIYYIVTLRQSEYDAIGTKDPNTLYVIIVEPSATPSVTPAPSATPSVTPSISVSITPSVTPW